MNHLPLISCLCVTRNNRTFLKNAIHYFIHQTYPNKELIVVSQGNCSIKEWIPEDFRSKINLVKINNTELTLGELRNISIENCKGEYFCQWDDDDWYHNRRLEVQMDSLLSGGYDACILDRWIMYDAIRLEAYLSFKRPWEGSLLCKTTIFNEGLRYPPISKGEDSDFVVKLMNRNGVHFLTAPYLYFYIFHGGNTFDADHFQMLFNAAEKLSIPSSILIGKILKDEYPYETSCALVDRNFKTVE